MREVSAILKKGGVTIDTLKNIFFSKKGNVLYWSDDTLRNLHEWECVVLGYYDTYINIRVTRLIIDGQIKNCDIISAVPYSRLKNAVKISKLF